MWTPLKFVRPFLAAMVIVSGTGISLALEPSPPTVDELAQRLAAWRASFVNIQVTYRSSTPAFHRSEHPGVSDDELIGRNYILSEWTWSDIGGQRIKNVWYDDGKVSRSWSIIGVSSPGETEFRATYPPEVDSESAPKSIWLYRANPANPRSVVMALPFFRVWFSGRGQWIDEVLSEGDASIVDFEHDQESGQSRVGLMLRGYKLWLDSRYDYLPSKVEWVSDGSTGWHWEATSFSRFGTDTWFPESGTSRISAQPEAITLWQVTDLDINRPLSNRIFDPPPLRDGVKVFDTRSGAVYTKGRSQPRSRPGNAAGSDGGADGEVAAQTRARIVEATPSTIDTTRVRLILLAAAVLLLAFWYWLRRRAAPDY